MGGDVFRERTLSQNNLLSSDGPSPARVRAIEDELALEGSELGSVGPDRQGGRAHSGRKQWRRTVYRLPRRF